MIPLRRVEGRTPGAEVCLAMSGGRGSCSTARRRASGSSGSVTGRVVVALIPTVAHRFGLGKAALFGSL